MIRIKQNHLSALTFRTVYQTALFLDTKYIYIYIYFLVLLVLFRLGEVLDPQAKLYMILYGDRGESGKIYLTPSDGATFEPGKQYRVSVNIKDIGKV